MKSRLQISIRRSLPYTLAIIAAALTSGRATAEERVEPERQSLMTDYVVAQTEYGADPTVLDGETTSGDGTRPRKKSLINALLEYLDDSNKEKSNKKIDFSFLGGPFYSSEAKFGLGLVAAAVYRTNPCDSACIPSNVSIYGDVSTSLLYSIGLSGNHISCDGGMRLSYDLDFVHFPTKFWGIGYENCKLNSNETKYTEFSIRTKASALWRLSEGLYAGPTVDIDHVRASKIKGDKALWEGQPLTTTDIGVGIALDYDTRDNLTAPERGYLLSLEQKFFPRFLANGDHSFSLTEFSGNIYSPVWKGGTFAGRLHGRFTYGKTPWTMLSSIGGSYTLRGYYENRYRDKNAIDLTAELRQRIWKRWGVAVWGGVGSVFRSKGIKIRELLPNGGIGIRWEFKKHVNVRLDYGFGRGESGVVFNINEAF